jgi:SMI1-KNR4 cell-wall
MPKIFHDFELANFWEDSDYARQYVEKKPTPALIASIEKELGYRLPASYIELMKTQNGGIPRNTCYPTKVPTSWAPDHVAIIGIMGIGRTKTYSLCGELGSKFMREEWGYPDIGICVCDCPSAGHDMIMLDYRRCGKEGEPKVVHVDQESDYKITPLAKDFETFVRGLVHTSVYDTSAEDLKKDLAAIDRGSFSKRLADLIAKCRESDFGPIIRRVCRSLTTEKGYFALHADEKSYLMYDIQFYLYTHSHPVKSEQAYLTDYPDMIAMGDGELTTGGYAPNFVKDWFGKRRAAGDIVATRARGLAFSQSFLKTFRARLREFQ